MAKANLKRVTEANRGLLGLLFKLLIGSNAIHLLSIFIFPSQRIAWRYLIYYLISSLVAFLSYSFLSATGLPKRGKNNLLQTPDDLSSGIHQYVVDYCYISILVWVTTGWISHSCWKIYWTIPLYGSYKAFQILRKVVFPSL